MSRETWRGAGSTLGLIVLTLVVIAGWTQAVDSSVASWFVRNRQPGAVWAADLLGIITTPALVAAIGLAALFFAMRQDLRRWSLAVGAVGVAFLSGWLLKVLVDRPRPLPDINLHPESEASYPSGHVLIVAVVVGCVVLMTGRFAMTALVAVGLTSVQRLVVGAHWLTDVVAAWLLAAVILALVSGVQRRWQVDRALTGDPRSQILGRC